MNPLISVIIPVFNVKEYLNEAVFSVLDGEYKNIEVFLIDDGSNDGSGEICDEIAKIDKRVIVIHKKNAGPSGARNTALALAKGEYFAFVDSDDIVSKDFLHTLYELIKKYDVKMSMVKFKSFSKLNEIINLKQSSNEKIFTQKEYFEGILSSKEDISCCVWNKLYHKSIFKDLRFIESRLYEDVDAIFRALEVAKSIIVSDKICYFYRIRDSSITNTEFSNKHLDSVKSAKEFSKNVSLKYPELKNLTIYALCNCMTQTSIRIIKSQNKNFYTYIDEYQSYVKNNLKTIIFAKNTSSRLTKSLIICFGLGGKMALKTLFKAYHLYKSIKVKK